MITEFSAGFVTLMRFTSPAGKDRVCSGHARVTFVSQLDLFLMLVEHSLYPDVTECPLMQKR